MKEMNKMVVKLGTSSLTEGSQKLSRKQMLGFVQQVCELQSSGKQVILVSSGAIAAGKELVDSQEGSSKQMFASIGQAKLMQAWAELFSLFDIKVGQVLLTSEDFFDRKRALNARDTISCMLQHKVVPIINEHDMVAAASHEIRIGDNDNLAAFVGNLLCADGVILLTDQEGLFTADPRHDSSAQLIAEVEKIDETIYSYAKGSGSKVGTGGMATKIQAAQRAVEGGTPLIIASSSRSRILLDLANGKKIGTFFPKNLAALEKTKQWLLLETIEGEIQVNQDAAHGIREGASLRSSGVLWSSPSFDRGAIVRIIDPAHEEIAVGIANYSSKDVQAFIAKELRLFSYGSEIVYRSELAQTNFKEERV